MLILCKSAAAKECSKQFYDKIFKNENHQCRKQKACSILEYDNLIHGYTGDGEDKGTYSLSYIIESPESATGERKTEPFKIVGANFYLWNELTLLANVFGALGLTIGFSIIGGVEWLTDKVTVLFGKAKLKSKSVASKLCPQVL